MGGGVDPATRASAAVRQIEYWYKHYIDSFVQEGRVGTGSAPGRPGPITAAVLAQAHEQAWRHAIVRAQRSTNPQEWAQLGVNHEKGAYESLLSWAAGKYGVSEDDVVGSQTSRGYRHHARDAAPGPGIAAPGQ